MEQSLKGAWTSFCVNRWLYSRLLVLSGHVETVCLLVLRNPVTHINIDVDV